MLKRVLMLTVLAAAAAHAETVTAPMLQGIHECDRPGRGEARELKLAFTVTETGTVQDIRIVQSSGDASEDERAKQCVAQFTFKPATRDGVPVAHPWGIAFHWGHQRDAAGDHRAFSRLERDADRRCHKLYPVDATFLNQAQPISLVVITRLPSGEVQMLVTQSAGDRADKNAVACLKAILPDHEDLPASFSRGIAINWSHRY